MCEEDEERKEEGVGGETREAGGERCLISMRWF